MLSFPIRVRAIYKHITYNFFQFRALTLPPNFTAWQVQAQFPFQFQLHTFKFLWLREYLVSCTHWVVNLMCVSIKKYWNCSEVVSAKREKNKPTEMPVNLNKNEQNVATWKLITVAVVASHLREPPSTPPALPAGALSWDTVSAYLFRQLDLCSHTTNCYK